MRLGLGWRAGAGSEPPPGGWAGARFALADELAIRDEAADEEGSRTAGGLSWSHRVPADPVVGGPRHDPLPIAGRPASRMLVTQQREPDPARPRGRVSSQPGPLLCPLQRLLVLQVRYVPHDRRVQHLQPRSSRLHNLCYGSACYQQPANRSWWRAGLREVGHGHGASRGRIGSARAGATRSAPPASRARRRSWRQVRPPVAGGRLERPSRSISPGLTAAMRRSASSTKMRSSELATARPAWKGR
jgi:hypothetical protein